MGKKCSDLSGIALPFFRHKGTGIGLVTNPKFKTDTNTFVECSSFRHLFWMSSKLKDKKGRKANPVVIEAAQRIYSNAASQVESQLGDSSAVHDLMEKAIYSVSGFIQRHGVNAITSSLDGVILAAFHQLLQNYLERQNRHVPLDELEKWQDKNVVNSNQEIFYILQMEDLLENVPPEVAVSFRMLYEGYTAEEIGLVLGISADSVRAQVYYWRKKIKGLENIKKSRWGKWRRPGSR
jgi:DNA-directed RNA polymerase specialized sigma24 family protein